MFRLFKSSSDSTIYCERLYCNQSSRLYFWFIYFSVLLSFSLLWFGVMFGIRILSGAGLEYYADILAGGIFVNLLFSLLLLVFLPQLNTRFSHYLEIKDSNLEWIYFYRHFQVRYAIPNERLELLQETAETLRVKAGDKNIMWFPKKFKMQNKIYELTIDGGVANLKGV